MVLLGIFLRDIHNDYDSRERNNLKDISVSRPLRTGLHTHGPSHELWPLLADNVLLGEIHRV